MVTKIAKFKQEIGV